MGLSGKEKFSYGLGAVGKDMVYMLSASYILYYYLIPAMLWQLQELPEVLWWDFV